MKNPGAILLTGAGGGIGSALARAYAAPGVNLFLCDVNTDWLERACLECQELGAVVRGEAVDVTDPDAMERFIGECDSVRPLDLVIANAGISHGNLKKEETAEQIRRVFSVNLEGTLNTVLPVLPLFRERKRGQIAIMSSLAGFRGVPHSPSYCASKAAIRVFGQGLRARVAREGVEVSVVIPAFVKTTMTAANLYRMPAILDSDNAAQIIKRKLERGKPEFVFPTLYAFGGWVVSSLPSTMWAWATRLR